MAQSKRKPALIAIPRQGDRGSPPSPRSATLAPASQAAYASHAQSSALDSSERTHVTAQGNFNGNTGGGGGVILRIKRKRGTEPVDALRIGLLLGEEEEEQVAAGGSKRRIVEKSKEDNSGAGEWLSRRVRTTATSRRLTPLDVCEQCSDWQRRFPSNPSRIPSWHCVFHQDWQRDTRRALRRLHPLLLSKLRLRLLRSSPQQQQQHRLRLPQPSRPQSLHSRSSLAA